jgi:FkbM family methyltransferase
MLASWHNYPKGILGLTERHLLAWFERSVASGETWLDIGALYGYTAIALTRLVGPWGRVFAFEPMLSTAGYLAQTRRLNDLSQLTVLPLGLASPEELELRRLPSTCGMVDSTLHRHEPTETVLVTRLDWLWPRICGKQERIDGIKIDVQGMEIEVLRGMLGVLRRFRPKLVIELHQGVARCELLEVLKAAGYSRPGRSLGPIKGEVEPEHLEDRSYEFQADIAQSRATEILPLS